MENFNSTEPTESIQENGSHSESKRRISYVSRDLKSMISFVSLVYTNLGHSGYHNNKQIAAVHQLSPDSIKQHLTSAQQYNLLELKHREGYRVTNLFKRIFLPINDVEKKSAIIESLRHPETYQTLFREYEFHVVPPVSGLKNHFIRHFEYNDKISELAAEVFLTNLKDFELLDSRNVLNTVLPTINKSIAIEESTKADAPTIQQPEIQEAKKDEDLFELPIPLPNKRKAYLRYPLENLTRKDINVITKALEFIASSLEDE